MNLKDLTKTIINIERRNDVNSITYNSINIWPLVRLGMYVGNSGKSDSAKVKAVLGERVFYQVVKKARGIKWWFQYKTLKKEMKHIGEIDCLFYSRREDHSDNMAGKLFNRHIDPVIGALRKEHTCFKIEMTSNVSSEVRYEPTYFVKFQAAEGYNLTLPKEVKRDKKVNEFSLIDEFNEGLEIEEKINKDWLENNAKIIDVYTYFFKEVLSFIKPKVVFLVCFYSPVSMALIRACKQLGIQTIEIQHGKQGKYHPMYSNWTRIPENGYELLPDQFWVWGEESKKNIENNRKLNKNKHNAVIAGNEWIRFWKKIDENEKMSSLDIKEKNFIKRIKKYKKVILFSGQEDIPDFVIEAINKSDNDYFWLIRLHPIHQKNNRIDIENKMKKNIMLNFDIENSSELALYLLLENSDIHVTNYSSVCYEALSFNVPTIITHETGLFMYDSYIKEEIFLYSDDSESLLECISSLDGLDSKKETSPYIETSEKLMANAIDVMFDDMNILAADNK